MKQTYKNWFLTLSMVITLGLANIQAQVFTEGFEDVAGLYTNGWSQQNLSSPVGTNTWAQSLGGVGVDAHSGTQYSMAEVNYESTTGAGTISNWLLTKTFTLGNGDSVIFWTVAYNSATYPDRLECRLSSAGASSNCGNSATTTGDFSTLIVSVNPNLDLTSYPNLEWGRFGGVVSGLTVPTLCRVGFRYWVTDGGPSGSNSSTIALDDVTLKSPFIGIVDVSTITQMLVYPNPVADVMNLSFGKEGSYEIMVVDNLGQLVKIDRLKGMNTTLDLNELESGSYLIRVIDLSNNATSQKKFIKS